MKKKYMSIFSIFTLIILVGVGCSSKDNSEEINKDKITSDQGENEKTQPLDEIIEETDQGKEKLEETKPISKEEKVENLMITVDSWSGKSTSLEFRNKIIEYLNLDSYEDREIESYDFGYVSTVVWGLLDRPDKILIMSNFDVRVYENYDFIVNKDSYSKVKLIGVYATNSLLHKNFNYEAYAIQDLNTGEVQLITQDDYTLELKNKDENFRKIY